MKNTFKLAVIGHPISHSASPKMHNAMIQYLKLPYVYDAIDISPDSLEFDLQKLKEQGIKGFNVTIPHKESILAFLDEITPEAKRVGAVNTVINKNGKFIGYNTDGLGFVRSLEEEAKLSVKDKRVVILGAGGSSKAISLALIDANIHSLTILNRSLDRAQSLAKHLGDKVSVYSISSEAAEHALKDSDIVINTTPLGMTGYENETPYEDVSWVKPSHVVCDIIYVPKQTRFMKETAEKGATVIGGAGMLAGQGAIAFELFTGHTADIKIMRSQI